MGKPKPNPTREDFHRRVVQLYQILDDADPDNDFDREVLSILNQLCWALDRLALGDRPEIFRPAAKAYRGFAGPSSKIQQYRWRAVFYVEAAIQLHKTSIGEAVEHVAAAFDTPAQYLSAWRKPIINHKNQTPNAVKARTQIAEWLLVERSPAPFGGKNWTLAELLKRAKAEGPRLKAEAKSPKGS